MQDDSKSKRPPREHPKAYESPLWPHIETICSMRRSRKTWSTIALHLEQAHGLRITLASVRNFFRRTEHGRAPLGFDSHGSSGKRLSSQQLHPKAPKKQRLDLREKYLREREADREQPLAIQIIDSD
jgi:hypothetical protein